MNCCAIKRRLKNKKRKNKAKKQNVFSAFDKENEGWTSFLCDFADFLLKTTKIMFLHLIILFHIVIIIIV